MAGKKSGRKWLRHTVQLLTIALLLSPVFGFRFFQGSLIASELFGISLTDPVAFIDFVLSAKTIYWPLLGGAVIVILFYLLSGGRAFCSWVCPVYLVSEGSSKLNKRFKIFRPGLSRNLKFWVLGAVFLLSALTSTPVFEQLSPIGISSKQIATVFSTPERSAEKQGETESLIADVEAEQVWRININASLWILFTIVLVDIFVKKFGWCRYVCPVGAFYNLLQRRSLTRVSIDHEHCDKCAQCFKVCFMPEVLKAPVYDKANYVVDGDCTNCLNCIDACPTDALNLTFKVNRR